MSHERSIIIRKQHSRKGHKLKVQSFSSNVPVLQNNAGTFEVCSCKWAGWLSVTTFEGERLFV